MDTPHDPTLMTLAGLVAQHQDPTAIPPADWPAIITAALQQGLGPMLLWAVKQQAPDLTTASLWEPLRAATRQIAIHHVWLERAQIQVNETLAAAGIPALWLKGIVLASTVYPQPAMRGMGDLDVLVPYDQREIAFATLQQQGYHFGDIHSILPTDDPLVLEAGHHYHLHGPEDYPVTLELHFRLPNTLLSLSQLDWFWTQTTTIDHELIILRPEAHLLYLCAHALIQHGEVMTALRSYFDLHRLITRLDIDWALVIDRAVSLRWTYAVERALSLTATYFATPLPQDVLTRLQQDRLTGEDVAHVASLQGAGHRWERMRSRLAGLTFKDQVRLIHVATIPPRDYMRRRYAIPAHRPTWPYYFVRWWDQGRQVLAWLRQRGQADHD